MNDRLRLHLPPSTLLPRTSRRSLLALGVGALVAVGCDRAAGSRSSSTAAPSRLPPGSRASAPPPLSHSNEPAAPASAEVLRVCGATEPNIEGPFYRPGAPVSADLRGGAHGTEGLELTGHVRSLDCKTPLAGAVLDVWQADAEGHYDNDGSPANDGRAMRLRGRVTCDALGHFRLVTLVPGRYRNGPTYRPAHVHVKVSAPGHRTLTTQLYFPDDPFNAADPFFRPSLVVKPRGSYAFRHAVDYDFVLFPS